MGKILIAFYSRRGQNYVNGSIRNLEKGNNEVMVEKILQLLGGDAAVFRIDTVTPYPEDYTATTQQAQAELRQNARPALKSPIESIADYDTVILGYPNWWGQPPMPVFTFLESYDFGGKTIVPFCTHEGSGLSDSLRSIARACPHATMGKPLAVRGANVANADQAIKHWLEENGLC